MREVGLVPSDFPCRHDQDDDVLRKTPGLYPDSLFPITEEGVVGMPHQWRSIWVTVQVDATIKAGEHPITVTFKTSENEVIGCETFMLDVIPIKLPRQQLINTHWFHSDCLATAYDVEVFSEAHWELIETYFETATDHGMNMLLTPLFTPPLDTEIGTERPTVQLVKVYKDDNQYTFNFDQLDRWIKLARMKGMKYFEFAHLFTQWGAHHAPKIMAEEKGEMKRIFGWEIDAHGEAYKSFLSQFLPELVTYIKKNNLDESVYFHISDEPKQHNIDSYRQASETIQPYVEGFPVIDALSDYDFYEQGLVKKPIPTTDGIEPFLGGGVPDLWTYYCVSQYKEVSNRHFVFPSVRNRILGLQLYKFNIKGFLHWGYNFWYSQLSRKAIDPFQVTDADKRFPSGEAFLVYPGENGPIESIRLEVFYEGLQDTRALALLEELAGRDRVIEVLEASLNEPITFKIYPRDSKWLLEMREKVNAEIASRSKEKSM